MSDPTTSGTQPFEPILPRRLARLGMGLLIALPLGMWVANRSAPLFLGLAALCFLASAVAVEGWWPLLRRLRKDIATPIGLALGGFLLWSLISIAWSHRPRVTTSARLDCRAKGGFGDYLKSLLAGPGPDQHQPDSRPGAL